MYIFSKLKRYYFNIVKQWIFIFIIIGIIVVTNILINNIN